MFRHLFPHLCWSTYERDGERRLVLWRQWFGRVWDVLDIRIPGKAA